MSADDPAADNRCVRAKAAEHLIDSLLAAAASASEAERHAPTLTHSILEHEPDDNDPLPICIIDSLNIRYTILEASERLGGRLYTYRFNGEEGKNAPLNDPERYQYYEVGAMRFPNIPFMRPVMELFKALDMFKDIMIKYEFEAPCTFQYYNGIRHQLSGEGPIEDIFEVSRARGGAVPNEVVSQGAHSIIKDIVKPFADKFYDPKVPFPDAWRNLAQHDHHRMRTYLTMVLGHKQVTVDWLETNMAGTGLFDSGFVQTVMDFIDFGMAAPKMQTAELTYRPKPTYDAEEEPWEKYDWWTVDGGVDHIADRMRKRIRGELRMRRRVTKIETTKNSTVLVTLDGHAKPEGYSQVVCTIPLGCLGTVTFPKREDLGYLKRVAIRSLRYDSSAKIGLHFEKRWWEDDNIMGGKPIRGGQSNVDLPVRMVVYPSYGFKTTGRAAPGVLIASYSWLQDAQRLGSLIHSLGSKDHELLIQTVLNDLAEIHGISVEKMGPLRGYHAWFWDGDVNARGTFAKFGPGQFGNDRIGESLYASMKTPAGANGRIHIAGEATSVHHGWVLGAINSAWRAVNNLIDLRPEPGLREKFYSLWKPPQEETKKVNSVLLGEMSREHPDWGM